MTDGCPLPSIFREGTFSMSRFPAAEPSKTPSLIDSLQLASVCH